MKLISNNPIRRLQSNAILSIKWALGNLNFEKLEFWESTVRMRSFPSTPRHLPSRSQKIPSLTPLKPPRQRRISVSLEVDLSTAAGYGDTVLGHVHSVSRPHCN